MKPFLIALVLLTATAQAEYLPPPKKPAPTSSPVTEYMRQSLEKYERRSKEHEQEKNQIYLEGRIKRLEDQLYMQNLYKSY
jgi:hypothetical protein